MTDPNGTTAIRLFILDDHEIVRHGMRAIVQASGMDVVGESGSVQEAIRIIPALSPDVMLLDVSLPDGSGVDVCRQVRSIAPRIRALMLTTFDDDEVRLAASLAGASGYVLKQVRGEGLVTSIRRVAAGEQLLDREAIDRALARAKNQHWATARRAALTDQEQRILDLIASGRTNRQIGAELGIKEKTVKGYLTNVFAKLGVENRTQAAVLVNRRNTR